MKDKKKSWERLGDMVNFEKKVIGANTKQKENPEKISERNEMLTLFGRKECLRK